VLLCGYKLIVKLLFTPPDRGAGSVVDIEDDGLVVSTADTGADLYGPKNRSAIAASIETKRILFINQTIVMFMKRNVRRNLFCFGSALFWATT
jgi:hypothetical protein